MIEAPDDLVSGEHLHSYLACRQMFSCCIFTWHTESKLWSLPFFIRAPGLPCRLYLITSQRLPPPNTITLWVRILIYELGERRGHKVEVLELYLGWLQMDWKR